MKAFVIVALCVASVAARSFDVDTLQKMNERSLLKQKLVGENRVQFPLKNILGGERYPVTVGDMDYPVTTGYGLDMPTVWGQYGQRRVTVLSFEEIIATPLFREYYNIPLFRQYLEQYPVVFPRYIQSVLFQQFWTVPAFQQYFRNPVLFYKYIVPQVQVVAQTVSQNGIYGQGLNYDSVVDQYKNIDIEGRRVGGIEQYLNKNVYPEGREVVVGDYLNRIFNGLQQQNRYTVPLARDFYGYGQQQQQYFGGNTMTTPVNYKFLLDRIYKTLFVDRPTVGDVTEVKTDVKVAPAQREAVVEPITGQTQVVVEEPKIVDVKVNEKVIPRTQVEELVRKEVLLQKLLVSKVISVEVYEILRTLPLYQVEQLFVTRQGEQVVSEELIRKEVLQKLLVSKVISIEVYEILKTLPLYQIEQFLASRQVGGFVTERDILSRFGRDQVYGQQRYNQLYNNEIIGDRMTPVYRELYNTYGQQVRV